LGSSPYGNIASNRRIQPISKYHHSRSVGSGGNMATSRIQHERAGTQTAGLAIMGNAVTATEEYNGATWTAGGTAPEAQYSGASDGTQTAAFVAGGIISNVDTNKTKII
jgi:hypothetical protein